MRGDRREEDQLFSYIPLEDRVPANHPLRVIRRFVDPILAEMSPRFDAIYAKTGRPSIPPEQLLRALLIQVLYTVRSERMLCEQLGYNMLFRWFIGLGMEDTAWDHSTYTQNRDRLIEHEVVKELFTRVMDQARSAGLLSSEHFSVDGTLIRAWASHKSFAPKDGPPPDKTGSRGNPDVDFKRQRRSNDTHASTTDPDARLMTKSNSGEAIPAYVGNVLMENRSKLAVDALLTIGSGTAERDAALEMLNALPGDCRKTVGADKNFDTKGFVAACREIDVTPHVARNSFLYRSRTGNQFIRPSAIDERTTRHAGYKVSQVARKVIETLFGDAKQHGTTIRQVKLRGLMKVKDVFTIAMLAANLRRLPRLMAICPSG
jgi:transposase